MEAKDLMLGNWIRDDNYCQTVEVSDIYLYAHTLKTCSPIPVTEEILKAIGFEEYEDLPLEGVFYRYWDKEYKYKLDIRNFWTNSQRQWYVHIDNDVCNTIGSGEFDYVHELQNLTRCITGFSLPITKEMVEDV
jgi:hypothetical protein